MPPRGPNNDRRRRFGLPQAAAGPGGSQTRNNQNRGVASGRNPGKKFGTSPGAVPATITYIGSGSIDARATSGNITAALPAGYSLTDGDLALVLLGGRPNASSVAEPTTPSGWTKHATIWVDKPGWTEDLRVSLYWAFVSGGSLAAATFAVSGVYAGSTVWGMGVYMAIYRGVNLATPFDTTAVTSSASAATLPWTPDAATSTSEGAMLISVIGMAASNPSFLTTTDANFTFRSRQATTAGDDHTLALADRLYTGTSAPTWNATSGSVDVKGHIATALNPALV